MKMSAIGLKLAGLDGSFSAVFFGIRVTDALFQEDGTEPDFQHVL